MARLPLFTCCLFGLSLASCDLKPAQLSALHTAPKAVPAPKPAEAPAAPSPAPKAPSAKLLPPLRGAEITIPAGTLRVGSATGTKLRNPSREADAVEVTMPTFSIDALPYPNDPERPPRASVTREEASRLCAEQEKRLCNELEWERACKGTRDAEYPSQKAFDPERCAREPLACASDLGVFALGTLGREWTGSAGGEAHWDPLRSAVVRGAEKGAEAAQHRCAARDAATPDSRSESLLFRCCRGEAPTQPYPQPRDAGAFTALARKGEDLRGTLRAMPETRGWAEAFKLWPKSALGEALSRAGRSTRSLAPWQAASPAFQWSPVPGEELVLLSGDSPEGAVLIAYYPLPDATARFAGSYRTQGEHTPILLAYKPDQREELLFSTCWGCGGEGGAVQLDAAFKLRFAPR